MEGHFIGFKSMKSIRLNKQSRNDILESIKEGFRVSFCKSNNLESLVPLLDQEREKLALKAWNDCFGNLVFPKYLTQFINLRGLIKISCEDGRIFSHYISRPMPIGSRVHKIYTVSEWKTVFSEVNRVAALIDLYNGESVTLLAEAKAVIESVNTTSQLIDVWLSVVPYLPAYLTDPDKAVRLPAIQTSRLDDRLNAYKKDAKI